MAARETAEGAVFWPMAAAGMRTKVSKKAVFMSALDGEPAERLRNKEDREATRKYGGGSQ
jgi:hypothetical protein